MLAGLVVLRGRDWVWSRAGEVDGPWPHEAGVTPLSPGLVAPEADLHVTAAASLGLAPVPVGVSLRDAVPVRLVL